MKLYFSTGACSLTSHIILEEIGASYEAILAPTKTHKLPDGSDYYLVNPLGYVPLLVLDDGRKLREGPGYFANTSRIWRQKKISCQQRVILSAINHWNG